MGDITPDPRKLPQIFTVIYMLLALGSAAMLIDAVFHAANQRKEKHHEMEQKSRALSCSQHFSDKKHSVSDSLSDDDLDDDLDDNRHGELHDEVVESSKDADKMESPAETAVLDGSDDQSIVRSTGIHLEQQGEARGDERGVDDETKDVLNQEVTDYDVEKVKREAQEALEMDSGLHGVK